MVWSFRFQIGFRVKSFTDDLNSFPLKANSQKGSHEPKVSALGRCETETSVTCTRRAPST